VFGPQVTQEYFQRPELTALAKIPDSQHGRNWHRMGDVGYFDEAGRLWFCGRKSQRVIARDRTYFTDQVEGIFNAHPAVFRTALVGVPRAGAHQPVLCVECNTAPEKPQQLNQKLLEWGSQHAIT